MPAPAPVSILARPEGRALHQHARPLRPRQKVSILARPEGRALQASEVLSECRSLPVSILARPEGRALRRRGVVRGPTRQSCFNPRPARRPGAASSTSRDVQRPEGVSILARPEGRALPRRRPASAGAGPPSSLVSILARPEGRALLGAAPCNTNWLPGFQSSPGPKAGRCPACGRVINMALNQVSILARPEGRALLAVSSMYRDRRHLVSILARPEGRALPSPRPSVLQRPRCFNPRPARRPGAAATSTPCSREEWSSTVSILARPEGRALPLPGGWSRWNSRFQSSPGPKAGRCPPGRAHERGNALCFNPRPARRPGAATGAFTNALLGAQVSILARPEGRALPRLMRRIAKGAREVSILARPEGRALLGSLIHTIFDGNHVSILARPEGRALPVAKPEILIRPLGVSILARPEGRALPRRATSTMSGSRSFNPRPARRPGAARPPRSSQPTVVHAVSILARPEGRALPGHGFPCVVSPFYCFNPRPARRPGAASGSSARRSPSPQGFNPRPARRPGAASCAGWSWRAASPSFNPRPARRPGAAVLVAVARSRIAWFQSSPGPKAGRCLRLSAMPTRVWIVSILARPEGRALLSSCNADTFSGLKFQSSPGPKAGRCFAGMACVTLGLSFNPRPARRPGAAFERVGDADGGRAVSILARPEGRALPARGPGAAASAACFNPRPARRPGAAGAFGCLRVELGGVSILARPEGRALPGV